MFTQCLAQRLFVFDRATRVGRNNHRALCRMCYLRPARRQCQRREPCPARRRSGLPPGRWRRPRRRRPTHPASHRARPRPHERPAAPRRRTVPPGNGRRARSAAGPRAPGRLEGSRAG
ncbi:hypothetical protein, partial [Nitrosomonas communis]|uniref:hypothetical protein n=1 Tax=Nitrosomonas communis TaxID=44574 RepID=UPI003D2A75C0